MNVSFDFDPLRNLIDFRRTSAPSRLSPRFPTCAATMTPMRLLNWNILAGGGARVDRIVERILYHASDICVLTEFRKGKTGTAISDALDDAGFSCLVPPTLPKGRNSAAIFFQGMSLQPAMIPIPLPIAQHIFCGNMGDLLVIGLFGATPAIGKAAVSFLAELAKSPSSPSMIAIGDFFFGPQPGDDRFRRILAPLSASGWGNLWLDKMGVEPFWSFDSGRGKSQPDHIYVYGTIKDSHWTVRYSEQELQDRISDHAPMIAEVLLGQDLITQLPTAI